LWPQRHWFISASAWVTRIEWSKSVWVISTANFFSLYTQYNSYKMPPLDCPLFHILLMLFGIYPAVNCVWSWRTSQTCWTISLNYFYIFRSAFWGPPTYVWFSWDIKMARIRISTCFSTTKFDDLHWGENYIFFALLLSSHISVCFCIRFV